MAHPQWQTVGLGVETVIDGIAYSASPAPAGMRSAGKYVAWRDDRVLGTAVSLREAQILCERAAARRKVPAKPASRRRPPFAHRN